MSETSLKEENAWTLNHLIQYPEFNHWAGQWAETFREREREKRGWTCKDTSKLYRYWSLQINIINNYKHVLKYRETWDIIIDKMKKFQDN